MSRAPLCGNPAGSQDVPTKDGTFVHPELRGGEVFPSFIQRIDHFISTRFMILYGLFGIEACEREY